MRHSDLRPKLIAAIGSFDTSFARNVISEWVESEDAAVRMAATEAMLSTRPGAAAKHAVKLLSDEATASAGIEMIVDAMRREAVATQLTESVTNTKLPPEIARVLLRRIRTSGGQAGLEEAIRRSGELDEFAWKLTPELSKRVVEMAQRHGSAARGEAIYRRTELQCINCHAIGSGGGIVGPNLISLGGSSQTDYILESLLEPNAKLKEGYSSLSVLTDDGELINGISIGKSDAFVSLRLADGKERKIPVDSIEQQRPGKSLMPAGMLDQLTEAELADLVAFLSELGRTPAYTVSTAPLVRSLETLVFNDEANRLLNRTSMDTVAGVDPRMNWRPMTSRVDGTIPMDELDVFRQHETTPPTSFVRFQVASSSDAESGIIVPTEGIECWVDGKPTPIWELKSRRLSVGNHTIVLAIDRSLRKDPFAVALGDSLIPVAFP